MEAPDAIVTACHNVWEALRKRGSLKFMRSEYYTIMAGFVLSGPVPTTPSSSDISSFKYYCISVGSGSKCLPQALLPHDGRALHDSHAEVVARRGAVRWFFEEIARYKKGVGDSSDSEWIEWDESMGKWRLRDQVRVHMYVSTLPCGDASMRMLGLVQDPAMAALKDANLREPHDPNVAIRGRDNYSALGALRSKPGRADSQPSLSMSCSDKIALWTGMGIQGALLSELMVPVYVDSIVIGDVPPDEQAATLVECQRAFSMRRPFDQGLLPAPYRYHTPRVSFTNIEFCHAIGQMACPECVAWNASEPAPEILIDGRLRGASSKRNNAPSARTCKANMLGLFTEIMGGDMKRRDYHDVKAGTEYAVVKRGLREGGPLTGWIISAYHRAT